MSQGFAREARLGVNLHVGETLYETADTTFAKADYPGLYGVRVKVQGAGGGGGGAATTGASQAATAGGGGGGGYSEKIILAADLSASETVTVGTGGAGGTAGNNNGTNGEDSSFGSHAVGGGGGGGSGSPAVSTPRAGAPPGAGGTATGGDLNIPGDYGLFASRYSLAIATAAGGGSVLGATSVTTSTSSGTDGLAGQVYGGGGGGGGNSASQGTNRAGGAGAAGIVIIEVLYERKIAVDEDIHPQYLNDARHVTEHVGARVYRSTDQTITGLTIVSFDTEVFDDADFWAASPNPTRITLPSDGRYLIGANLRWSTAEATGTRQARILQNGTTYVASDRQDQVAGGVRNSCLVLVDGTAGDYFEVEVFEDITGSATLLAPGDEELPSFWVQRISD